MTLSSSKSPRKVGLLLFSPSMKEEEKKRKPHIAGERVVEENLLVAKNKLDQSGTKNHKFFLSKQVREGNLLVMVEGEGEKRQGFIC